MDGPIAIAAFYRFVPIRDPGALRLYLLAAAERHALQGSILVAGEGVNGTVASTRPGLDRFFGEIAGDPRLVDLDLRRSSADEMPFKRLKVRLKQEIVTLRQGVDPGRRTGTHVDPADWNELISDPDVLVIDTRNDEEVQLGTFDGAVNPNTTTFSEFAEYVAELDPADHPTIAMFCTGGIRCEKASAFMLEQGFDDVRQLRGGILNYFESVPTSSSMWQGECFVFDERVTVGHDLEPGSYTLCRGCRRALSAADLADPRYEEGVACPFCDDALEESRRAARRERHRQELLAQQRGERHVGRRA